MMDVQQQSHRYKHIVSERLSRYQDWSTENSSFINVETQPHDSLVLAKVATCCPMNGASDHLTTGIHHRHLFLFPIEKDTTWLLTY